MYTPQAAVDYVSQQEGVDNILHLKQSASTAANTSSMKTHFNIFYNMYQRNNPDKRPDLTIDNIKKEEVTDNLVGGFVNYLCRTATCKSGGRIKKINSFFPTKPV